MRTQSTIARLIFCLLLAIAMPLQLCAQSGTTLYSRQPQQGGSWWNSIWGNGTSGRPPVEQGKLVSVTPHPAIVRVIATETNGASLGSGTLIIKTEQYGIVITNWHVVKDAQRQKNGELSVLVLFPDSTQYQGHVLKLDDNWDLAAIQIPVPKVDPLPITANPPKPNDQLWIAGYGSGNFALQSGRCTQYLAPHQNWPEELVELSAAARQGDSGGPILNANGEVAGVLFGQGSGYTTGSYGGRVVEFLQRVQAPSPNTGMSLAQVLNGKRGTGTTSFDNQQFAATEKPISRTPPPQPMVEIARAEQKPITPQLQQRVADYWNAPPATKPQSNELQPYTTQQTPHDQIAAKNANVALSTNSQLAVEAPQYNMQGLFGRTLLEQTKSVLALIGLLALLFKISGILTRPAKKT